MTSSNLSRFELGPGYSISPIILGGWQLAGGHGPIDEAQIIKDMAKMVAAGFTTWDCADIYTGVEQLFGIIIKKNRPAFAAGTLPPIQIHTKYVPDLSELPALSKTYTETVIDRSLKRLGVERLDLVQFHWWDFSIPGYIAAAYHLAELQQAGKIRYIGTTNFDAAHLKELVAAGIPILANQVQYSVLDHRPETALRQTALENNIKLLCYGTLAGGYLSERWLGVETASESSHNRSLIKYRLMIAEFGGFKLFQKLMQILAAIAGKHRVGIAEIAARYILQKPAVAGIIIGVRNSDYLENLVKLGTFALDTEDLTEIAAVLKLARGPSGPIFGLERDRTGPHGKIMKYNLNQISENNRHELN